MSVELAQERLRAEFRQRQQQLEHDIQLRELELTQQLQEAELTKKLDMVNACKVAPEREHSLPNTQDVGQAGNIGTWLEGVVNSNEPSGVPGGSSRPGLVRQVSQPVSALNHSLAQSGATLLTEMGFDQNTTQFITAQAMKAHKPAHRGHSLLHELPGTTSIVSGGVQRGREVHPGHATGAGIPQSDVIGQPSVSNMAASALAVTVAHAAYVQPGHNTQDEDSESESIDTNMCRKRKIQSDMLALPADNIKTPQVWPHYNLAFGFVTEAVAISQHFI